ncbi:GlgC family sugar phosphate nucleotidyltransferase [Sediminitomix flava]|uniref:Transferase family hexapeptide repeat protein n=1 Tax=Sediminitomix flava TaxID=379075 RepID=A0A315ZC78_SEDFL|nr:hypothetical protein [Sediminitomix flava]PWJ42344.1 transferase family hexapeptide repeat protein [Sediminitomix flava]
MKLIFPVTTEDQLDRLLFNFLDQSIFVHQVERLKNAIDSFIDRIVLVLAEDLQTENNPFKKIEEEIEKILPTIEFDIIYSNYQLDSLMLSELSDTLIEGSILICNPATIIKPDDFKVERVKEFQLFIYSSLASINTGSFVRMNDFGEIVEFPSIQENDQIQKIDTSTYYFKDGVSLKKNLKSFLETHSEETFKNYIQTKVLNKILVPFISEIESFYSIDLEAQKFFDLQAEYISSEYGGHEVKQNVNIKHSVLIEPVFIEEGCVIENSVIGPNVCVGKDVTIKNSVISNSLIKQGLYQENVNIDLMFIGNDMTCVLSRAQSATKS